MSEKYKTFEKDPPYFLTFTLVEWIPLSAISEFVIINADSIKHCRIHKPMILFRYCIIPGHIHLIEKSEKLPFGTIIVIYLLCIIAWNYGFWKGFNVPDTNIIAL